MSLALPIVSPVLLPFVAALALQAPPQAPSNPPAKPAATPVAPAAGAPVASQTPGATAPAGPATVEAWIPANSVAIVRAASLDALVRTATMMANFVDETEPMPDPLMLLGEAMGVEAAWDLVDRTRPIALAAAFSDVRPPVALTLIANSTDAAKFAASESLKAAGWTCTRHDDVVVLSMEPNERALAADAPLRVGLDRHSVVSRVDVEEIMAQYGELFRQGFESTQAERLAAVQDDAERAMMQSFFDGTLNVIESIETFGMAFDTVESRTRFSMELTSIEGSPLLDVGRVDTSGLAALTRAIDPNAPIAAVTAMDVSAFFRWLEPMMELGAKEAAKGGTQEKEDLEKARAMMNGVRDAYAAMGPLMTMSVRFDGNGMSASYGVKPADATACIDKLMATIGSPLLGAKIEGPTDATVAGHAVKSVKIRMPVSGDLGMAAVEDDMDAARAALAEAMTKFFGADAMPLTFAPHEGALLMTMGSPTDTENAVTRFVSKAASPAGADTLRALGTMNPGFAMRVSAEPLLTGISAFAVRMGGEPMPVNDEAIAAMKTCPPAYMMMGLDGRTWRYALEMDFPAVARLVRALNAASRAADPATFRQDVLAEMWDVQYALADFAAANGGKFPDDVRVLIVKDENGAAYLDDAKQLFDPWDRPYRFTPPAGEGELPRVYTLGADDREGGEGADADLSTDDVSIKDDMGDDMGDGDDGDEDMEAPR